MGLLMGGNCLYTEDFIVKSETWEQRQASKEREGEFKRTMTG